MICLIWSRAEKLGVVLNDLFTTGDNVLYNVNGKNTDKLFVKRGESVTLESGGGIIVPFSPSAGTGQSVTINSHVVTYDESTEAITVDRE